MTKGEADGKPAAMQGRETDVVYEREILPAE